MAGTASCTPAASKPCLGTLFLALAMPAAWAQTAIPNCSQGASGLECTIAAGNYDAPVRQDAGALNITNSGQFALTAASSPPYGLNFVSAGTAGASSDAADGAPGGNAGYLTVTNNGGVTLAGPGTQTTWSDALLMQSIGGDGGNYTEHDGKHNGGQGGSALGNLWVTNTRPIRLSGGFPFGASALEAQGIGGNGGYAGYGNGGAGGSGGVVQVQNSAALTLGTVAAPAVGAVGARGIGALSSGGLPGGGSGDGGAAGGAGGAANVFNQAPVGLAWDWGSAGAGSDALYGVIARSTGRDGAQTDIANTNGGAGGASGAVKVELNQSNGVRGDVSVTALNTGAIGAAGVTAVSGAAVAAVSQGGAGGTPYGADATIGANPLAIGGPGGAPSAAVVTVANVAVSAVGDRMAGILARSTGGAGGNGYPEYGYADGRDAAGGKGGSLAEFSQSVSVSVNSATVSTNGAQAPGILAQGQGGTGGIGKTFDSPLSGLGGGDGGDGGNGGNAPPVFVSLNGSGQITTSGSGSPGVLALSQGAGGGTGGSHTGGSGNPGAGGAAGGGSQVSVVLGAAGADVTTRGDQAPGVVAKSLGGAGGSAGSATDTSHPAPKNGGDGGVAAVVAVSIAAGAAIQTQGAGSHGVIAASAGGSGGMGSNSNGTLESTSGNGGAGGSTGNSNGFATVVGNSGRIATLGAGAAGILAQTLSGAGGAAGDANSVLWTQGGGGSSSGSLGSIFIGNAGSISTAGAGATGILAQSVAGGGGAGGTANFGLLGIGGSSALAADGGYVVLDNSGSIATLGEAAIGILTQSIGGGGGAGGDSKAAFAIGGNGAGGGDGGEIVIDLSGTIATLGPGLGLAHAVVAQSIGGGGGNGGNAYGTPSLTVALSIGGSGGPGGNGGAVTVTGNGGRLLTQGSNSTGILAQSIGGGGGSGGSAYATAVGPAFSAAFAVGGSGQIGGSGGPVSVTTSNMTIATGQSPLLTQPQTRTTNLAPTDAHGIVAQSIGGGGGLGGSALAQALAIAIKPNPEADVELAISASVSVGGSGAAGGSVDAGGVALDLGPGTSLVTSGQGSHGVLGQAIGGGGGTGGGSSSLAATVAYGRGATVLGDATASLTFTFAVGGIGGTGGTGGPVTMHLGDGGPASITTYGDYGNGVLLQSIGGGGGNAGFGSTSTAAVGATRTLDVGVTVGSLGGVGGNGGDLNFTLSQRGQVTTYGANAIGVAVQSIGGGGGASQGGAINLGGSYQVGPSGTNVTPGASLTLDLGGNGVSGGNGGSATLDLRGPILTKGGNAIGVLAQSIGGGGGIGGSAGSDASADNPVTLLGVREVISNFTEGNGSFAANTMISLGARGGTGGIGGAVVLSDSGARITTLGDWAHGVVAQSIGGGGGVGGTALATGSGGISVSTINVGYGRGGAGGTGGNGGSVSIDLPDVIATGSVVGNVTAGFSAIGLLAQSIGGGGGLGADGSDTVQGTISVGGSGGGAGGTGGNGGPVAVSGSSQIATLGEAAHAVVLQSIGGGGGVGGAGSSATLGQSVIATETMDLSVGGLTAAAGSGGRLSVNTNPLRASTRGDNAYALLAQSIGGGGGLGTVQKDSATATTLGGASGAGGAGGPVSINLMANVFQTSGVGAHGLVAQSIGGGGGIAGYASGVPTLATAPPTNQNPFGSGGSVTVNHSGSIITQGAGAHGIVAQSIASGGGLLARGGVLYAGSTGTQANALAGDVTITNALHAWVQTNGNNSVGIFAQSSGAGGTNGGTVRVAVDGPVQGGGGSGAGIWVADGSPQNSLTVDAMGAVSALSGTAINYTGLFGLDLTNNGSISGSWRLGSGSATNNALVVAGDTLAGRLLTNRGVLQIGPTGAFHQTRITGDLTQTATGTLVIDADFNTGRADGLRVQGDAVLAGQVRPIVTSVLPHVAVPFLTVEGLATGGLAGQASALFGYQVSRSNDQFLLSATANFNPASFGLAESQAAVANHLQSIWDSGGTPALGPLFALLGNTADRSPAAYSTQLRRISPDASLAPGARNHADARGFANSTLSCPRFEDSSALLVEGPCIWARVTGRNAKQESASGISGFKADTSLVQIGGQYEIAPNWFLGGSLAYGQSRLSSDDGFTAGDGETGYAAVTLKHQSGPWLFAGSAFGGLGQFDTRRVIDLPGYAAVAAGDPDTANLGLLLRAAYSLGREEIYLRPSLSLGAFVVQTGAYREDGAGALNLAMDSASQTTLVATPMLEVGGRMALAQDRVLRPFLTAGVSLLSADAWSQAGRLSSAPHGANGFTTRVPMDQVVGLVGAGVQLYSGQQIDLRLQYEGEFSDTVTVHGGSLILSLRF